MKVVLASIVVGASAMAGCDALSEPVAPGTFVLAVRGDASADLRGSVRTEVDSTYNPVEGVYTVRRAVVLEDEAVGTAWVWFGAPLAPETRTLAADGRREVAVTLVSPSGTVTYHSVSGTFALSPDGRGGFDGTLDARALCCGNPFSGRPSREVTLDGRFNLPAGP
jgi:hypothetical protein